MNHPIQKLLVLLYSKLLSRKDYLAFVRRKIAKMQRFLYWLEKEEYKATTHAVPRNPPLHSQPHSRARQSRKGV